MNIGINCRSFLRKQYAGIGRYAYNLVKSLSEIDQENIYSLYAKKGLFDFKRNLPRFSSSNFHRKIDWFSQGIGKILKDVDLYHSPSPDMLPSTNAKIIVSVHDLIYRTYPQGHTPETVAETEKHFQDIVQKASKIICCSENTRSDLHKFFSIQENKTCVIYQGVDKNKFCVLNSQDLHEADSLIKAKGVTGPFILFVGTIEPRKNLENLIYAFSLLKRKNKFSGKLVIVGMRGWMSEGLSDLIKKEGLLNDIQILGYLTDEELCVLHNKTEVFVFPSFYEGFGFPILEAFTCGAVVVTSNTSSCAEVAQDAAIQVNPYDFKSIADGIERSLEDEKLRNDLRQKGISRAKNFSFAQTAQKTLALYKEVFNG